MSADDKKDQKPTSQPKTAKPAWERAEAYEYVGPGIVPGVPAHDLDADTVKRLPIDLLRAVAHSDAYKPVKGGE